MKTTGSQGKHGRSSRRVSTVKIVTKKNIYIYSISLFRNKSFLNYLLQLPL